MPDLAANLLGFGKKQEPVVFQQPTVNQQQDQQVEEAAAQPEEPTADQTQIPQEEEQNTPEPEQYEQDAQTTQEPTQEQILEELRARFENLKLALDEVEITSSKDKIKAKVLVKKIEKILNNQELDQDQLEKVQKYLDQLEQILDQYLQNF